MALDRVRPAVALVSILVAPLMATAQQPGLTLAVTLVPPGSTPTPGVSPLALLLPHPIGAASFAVTTVNAGVSGPVTVAVDTGRIPLPVTARVCPVDPGSGACLAPPASSLPVTLVAGQTSGFAVVVEALAPIPLDRDFHRVHVHFTDSRGALVGSASVAVHNTSYARQIPITRGGTYSGSWSNDHIATGAPGGGGNVVFVDTTEPVVIENCFMRSDKGFVRATPGANVTLRNCRIYGIDPGVVGAERNYAVFSLGIGSLTMEHNYLEGVAWGAAVWSTDTNGGGRSTATGPIVVRYNRVRNLDGLASDGRGGRITNANPNAHHNGFVSFQYMDLPHGAEIAWNEIVNEPGLSATADMLSFVSTRGAASAPIGVHDNFIWGQYAPVPTAGNGVDPANCLPANPLCYNTYVAQVIVLDGHPTRDTAQATTAHVRIHGNQLVNTWGGIVLAMGHDNEAYGNRVVSTGRLRNGMWMSPAYSAGVTVADNYLTGPGVFYANSAHDNVVGFVLRRVSTTDPQVYLPPSIRSDYDLDRSGCALGASPLCFNNLSLPDPITFETEDNEAVLWRRKLADHHVTVGPVLPADCLFDRVEASFAALLRPAGAVTRAVPPFLVRHYPGTQAYIGLAVTDDHFYYLGPLSGNRLLDLGSAADWYVAAGCR